MSRNSKAPNSTRAKRRRRRRNYEWQYRKYEREFYERMTASSWINSSQCRARVKAFKDLGKAVQPMVDTMRQLVQKMVDRHLTIDAQKLRELVEQHGTDNSK